jgi:hypothetical protein
MMVNGRFSSVVSFNNRCSRYDVIRTDFARISAMEVALKTERAEQREAKSITEGLDSWKPPAPEMGLNSFIHS